MTGQLFCRGMCKILLQSYGQQWDTFRVKIPSNSNSEQQIISEMGPMSSPGAEKHPPNLQKQLYVEDNNTLWLWNIPIQR